MKLAVLAGLILIVLVSGCFQEETSTETSETETPSETVTPQSSETPANASEMKKLSADEMKSTVYQAIRKYIPASTIGEFTEHETFPITQCGESWYYPMKYTGFGNEHVAGAVVQVCPEEDGGPYTLEYMLSIQHDPKLGETYIKTLENGKVLVGDSKHEYDDLPGEQGRYTFGMQFPCQDLYYINIYTFDFYGEGFSPLYNISPIYEEYTIDKIAIENMVNEILNKC